MSDLQVVRNQLDVLRILLRVCCVCTDIVLRECVLKVCVLIMLLSMYVLMFFIRQGVYGRTLSEVFDGDGRMIMNVMFSPVTTAMFNCSFFLFSP